MRKRIISLMLAVAVILSLGVSAAASSGTQQVDITYRAIGIELNGEVITPCDPTGKTVAPFIMNSNGTTYLPLRAISQALGLTVGWDDATSTITLTSGGEVKTGEGTPSTDTGSYNVAITYRDIKVFLDGEQLDLRNSAGEPVEPFVMDGTTYLPLRVVGEALGLAVGWDNATSTASLKVDESGVKGITLNETSISYKPGETFKLVATINPEDAADKTVTWSSSDASVAAVSSEGLVTMVKPGTAIITAKTVNGKTAKCEVVVKPIEVTAITLSQSSIKLQPGGTHQLSAQVAPDDATDKSVIWTSSNTKVAQVTSTGLVTAVGVGSATITVKSGNVSASCSVVVAEVPWYSESMYRVGIDIPAGEYYAVATSKYGGYYCKYTDSSKDDIEDNQNFDTFTYFRTYEGQYLKLSGCKITPVENAPAVSAAADGYYGIGTYRVGVDIPAGDYYAVATSDYGGYYCKYTDSTKDDIEDNQNFDTFTYFRTYEGQYLKLSGCKITAIKNAPTVSASADGYYETGTYRVGIDIPAGEYKFIATSEYGGYYCAYTDITKDDIEDNESFDTVTYYTVQSGHYLKVSGAKFQYLGGAPSAPDTPADPGTGGSGETDQRYSFTDVKNLNSYLANAAEATTNALKSCNKVYSAGYSASMYANQAISYAGQSKRYLEMAISILESHVPIELTGGDYDTMLEMAQASYSILDQIDDLSYDSSNYMDVVSGPIYDIIEAGNLNLALQKLSVDLMKQFT